MTQDAKTQGTESADRPAPRRRFGFRSRGARFLILLVMIVLMFIPLLLVSGVIADRSSYQRTAINEVSTTWGGRVSFAGPALVVPVEALVTETTKDADGNSKQVQKLVRRSPFILFPETLDIDASTVAELRKRGIFEVPVYSAAIKVGFEFDTGRLDGRLTENEKFLWDKASISFYLPQTRSFTGDISLSAGNRVFDLEPGVTTGQSTGIHALTGDPRGIGAMEFSFGINGALSLRFDPSGRQTNVTLTSDWPHPSFTGAFLPNQREISDDGFSARWMVPHIARDLPQVSRSADGVHQANFGVDFFNPVNFYHKAQRAAKYGILFIALTFLTVFLMETAGSRRIHPAQFLLIGTAQSIFFLLLLAFAEQIGFPAAYGLASFATIALLSYYGVAALGLRSRAWVLFAVLITLYAVLYMVLQSADYALLLGSVLAFVAVAATMVLTRNETWFAPDEDVPDR